MQKHFSKKILLICLSFIVIVSLVAVSKPTQVHAANPVFYVAPNGSPNNDGSIAHPWDLQTALNQPARVTPGTIIWVMGGTYQGSYTCKLKGTASSYIGVNAYAGQRVTLVNNGSPALSLDNTYYVYFQGMEITGPNTTRNASRSPSSYGIRVNQGVSSNHIMFVNMIIHDVPAQGMAWWQALQDSTIYGSLIYDNGTTQLDHGIYAHNVSGTKIFQNNIVFDNASHGFHGYAETTAKGLNNFVLDGNTFFDNGSIGLNTANGKYGTYKRNILIGGLITTNNAVITNNYTYYPGSSGESLNLGYSSGSINATVQNNYFMGGSFVIGGGAGKLAMTGNTVFSPGGASGFNKSVFGANNWLSAKPGGVQVFVRPNIYYGNRANLTIYNWGRQNTVSIPASSLSGVSLRPGQTYELHNVQNYFEDIVTGQYNGSSLNVPMTNHSVAQPKGLGFKPASTFPEFGAFILIAK